LRVNIDPCFSRIALSAHLAAFLKRYPEVSVELIMRDHPKDVEACDCIDFYDAANARP
jgi:DNA-binding transcriptional LysR family regulator